MSDTPHPGALYGDGARRIQDSLDTRRLADAIARHTLHVGLTGDDIELIRSQSTVWISTVDADGWPDVSYKGGDVGFVEVATPSELRIPSYDGNGMMRTLGNIVDTGRIALLFVDTDRPWRMRVHGTARVSLDPTDLDRYRGADALIVVTVARVFPNCGRYIHRGGSISEDVPGTGAAPPIPDWKRNDFLRDALPARDLQRLADGE